MIRRFITLVTIVLISCSAIALPVAAKPSGDGPGNSANARMCQQGGWQSHARLGSSGIAFNSQGECVSFGAHGGELVALRGFTVSWTPIENSQRCLSWVSVTGFEPGTYPLSVSWYVNGSGTLTTTVVYDGTNDSFSAVRGSALYGPHVFTIDDVTVRSLPDCH